MEIAEKNSRERDWSDTAGKLERLKNLSCRGVI